MSAAALLDRLQGVRRTGNGRWVARCPAHGDKNPSLSVRELEDGRVLVHCFAGCGVEDAVSAAGLTLEALFPPRPVEHAPRTREAFPAADVLRAIVNELEILLIIAGDLEAGRAVPKQDMQRLRVAAERIRAAGELALGR